MIKAAVDDTKVQLRLATIPERVHAELLLAVTAQTLALEGYIKGSKLSGQVLNRRTGNLRASIQRAIDNQADAVIGRVFSDGTVKYARIHEYGGTIRIPDVYPVRAQALHFFTGGKEVFAKHVRAHTVTMPERSFMRSALADRRDAILAALKAAVIKGLRG